MIQRLFYIFLISTSLQTASYAQEATVWTLEECIAHAKKNNIPLKQLDLGIESAKANLQQSKMERLPNANGNFRHNANLGSGIDPSSNSFVTGNTIQSQLYSISSNIVLYNGSQIKNNIDKQKMQLELARLDSETQSADLEFSILAAYLQILLNEAQLEVFQEQSKITDKNYAQTQKLIEIGTMPAGNLLDIEAKIANDQMNIVSYENLVASSYLNLAQTLDYFNDLSITRPTIEPPSLEELESRDPTLIYEKALQTRPDMKTAALRTAIAEKDLKIAEGARMPTVSIGGSLSTNYSNRAKRFDENGELEVVPTSFFTEAQDIIYTISPPLENTPYGTQLSNNLGLGLGLNVSITIFNNHRIKNGITQSKINIENQRMNKQQTKNNLRKTIEQAYLDAKGSAQKYELSKKNVEAATNSLGFAEKRYELGALNTLDFFTAQNNLTTAELQMESARFEYYFRLKILDFYEGKEIGLE